MPPDGNGREICVSCRAVIHEPEPDRDVCENCTENASRLQRPSVNVTPISWYRRESVLRSWITTYKPDIDQQHGESGASPEECVEAVSTLMSAFFAANHHLYEAVDSVLVVPSTRRLPPHPLEGVISNTSVGARLRVGGLRRTAEPLDHRLANATAYAVESDLEGQRILLVDDVYASGARLQSAAAALTAAGVHVSNSVVIARRNNPGYHPAIQAQWDDATTRTFQWDRRLL